MRYSPDNQFLLLGCGDGQMRVFSASSGKVHYQWSTAGKSMIKLPVTAVRFRPVVEGDQKAKHIVLVAGSGGIVQHWHLTSGRMLNSITEKGNQVYAVDYRQDARLFATAGKDSFVRIYDESTKQVINTMSGGNGVSTAGHANRIFTIKFHPYDDNVVLTGGWDNTIQVWDVRTQHAIKRIVRKIAKH
jgi:WD40 repeat protein